MKLGTGGFISLKDLQLIDRELSFKLRYEHNRSLKRIHVGTYLASNGSLDGRLRGGYACVL